MKEKKCLLLSVLFAIVTVLMGCGDDSNSPSPEEVDAMVESFFGEALPMFFTETEYDVDTCFVINSVKELQSACGTTHNLPPIDFSSNTLIVGKLYETAGDYVKSQSLQYEDDHAVLLLVLGKTENAIASMANRYYWGLYPKLKTNSITVKKYYDEQYYN